MSSSASRPPVLGLPDIPPLRDVAARLRASFDIRIAPPVETALRLREKETDAALLSPIDFAKDSSDYLIIRGVGLAAAEPQGPVSVVFRPGIRTVRSLAVNPSYSSEIVLASILLAEEFESAPALVPIPDVSSAALRRADAALFVGTHPPESDGGGSIDLIEEWAELTELPFVYGIWCAREEALSSTDRLLIRTTHLETPPAAPEFTHSLSSEAEESLREFFRFAFYHGVMPDIPEMKWFDEESSRVEDEPLR